MSLLDLVRAGVRAQAKYHVAHLPRIDLKLDANEHAYGLDAELAEAVARAVAKAQFHRYPSGEAAELRDLLCAELACTADQLSFGNGSDELISILAATFAEPRAGQAMPRLAYPVPSFSIYRSAAAGAGVVPVEIPLNEDFTLDLDRVCDALVRERPNLVFLALPNNPTGTLWPRAHVEALAARFPDTIVVADEAYLDYAGETVRDLVPAIPNLILLRTLSKLGLAALRIGYLVADAPLVREVEKVRPPYNLGTLNQLAAVTLWPWRDRFRARAHTLVGERERLAAALAELPRTRVFPSRANFVLFRYGVPGDGHALWQRLVDRGILIRDLDRPGPLAACLRVTVGEPAENDRFLAAVRELAG